VQKDQGEEAKLTEGSLCPERGEGRPAARSCGGDAWDDRGRAEVGLLQVCRSPKSKHTGPAEVLKGSARPDAYQRRGIVAAGQLTGDNSLG
jgi:hypothetical protein